MSEGKKIEFGSLSLIKVVKSVKVSLNNHKTKLNSELNDDEMLHKLGEKLIKVSLNSM